MKEKEMERGRVIPSPGVFSSCIFFSGGSSTSFDTSSAKVRGTYGLGELLCRLLLRRCPFFLLLLWVGLLEEPATLSKLGLSLEPSLDDLPFPVDSTKARLLFTYWAFSLACWTATLEDLADRRGASVTRPLPLFVLEEPSTKVGKEKIKHQSDIILLKIPSENLAWFRGNSEEKGRTPKKIGSLKMSS